MVNGRWFIPAYICLYLIAPIANAFINSASTKDLLKYLVFFYSFSTIYGYLMFSKEFNEGMSAISLLGIYLIGAYLRREDNILKKINGKVCIALYFIIAVFLVLISILLFSLGIKNSIFGYLNPLIIIQSVFLFLFFLNLKMKHYNWINFISASSFSVYLFHMHPMIYGKYQDICKTLIENSIPVITIPIFFISIFAFCTTIDQIRIYLFRIMCKIGEKTLIVFDNSTQKCF